MRDSIRTWRARGVGIGAGVALALVLGTHAVAAQPDAWITTKAKLALLTTDGVSATDVNVDTVDGKVTLHGKVASAAEKSTAENAVKKIEGVAEVRNLLQVVSDRREPAVTASDDELKTRVEKELKADARLKDVSVQSVNAGVVLLAGQVETLTAHLSAVSKAADVPGVRRVASEIKSPDKLGDAEIYRDRPAETADSGIGAGARDMWITSGDRDRSRRHRACPGS